MPEKFAAEATIAVGVGVAMESLPRPILTGETLLFDDGERQGVMSAEDYRVKVAGMAGHLAAGWFEDLIGYLEGFPPGIVRDTAVTDVLRIVATGELWAAELEVIAVMHARVRTFIAMVREREILERPRLIPE